MTNMASYISYATHNNLINNKSTNLFMIFFNGITYTLIWCMRNTRTIGKFKDY